MATDTAIAIRKAEAHERIAKAARKIARATGVEVVDLQPAHKDIAIQGAVQAEALADFLASIAKTLTGADTEETDDDAQDAALAEAEATRLAEKLDVPALTTEPDNVFDQLREAIKNAPPKAGRNKK